jgi:hypothetical protein
LFFGIIHGLGFSNYFKAILGGNATSKLLPLAEFALGIEAAQIVVFCSFDSMHIVQTVLDSRKGLDFVMSAFIIGVVLPMIIENEIWTR